MADSDVIMLAYREDARHPQYHWGKLGIQAKLETMCGTVIPHGGVSKSGTKGDVTCPRCHRLIRAETRPSVKSGKGKKK